MTTRVLPLETTVSKPANSTPLNSPPENKGPLERPTESNSPQKGKRASLKPFDLDGAVNAIDLHLISCATLVDENLGAIRVVVRVGV